MILRKVNINDARLLYQWVNDPLVRKNSIYKSEIEWESHLKWLNKKIKSDSTIIFILEKESIPIGQIRFDKKNGSYEIDYSIDSNYRNNGYGKLIVDLGCSELHKEVNTPVSIKALVKSSNISSGKIFLGLDFVLYDEEEIKGEKLYYYIKINHISAYIVASEKTWNQDLIETLEKRYPTKFFLRINKGKYFTEELIFNFNPEKIFLPHWSYIIPEEVFSNFECVVFHMTDLPYGRGGSPLQNLIIEGFKKTKICALRVVKELDAGDIYLKREMILSGTAEEIFIRANEIIITMITEIMEKNMQPKPQEGEPVFFKRRKPKDGNIGELTNLDEIYDYIRMLDAEGYPKAYIENKNFIFEFTRASLKSDKTILADVRIIKK